MRWLRWAFIPMLMAAGSIGSVYGSVVVLFLSQAAIAWYVREASELVEPGLPPARIQ